MAPPGRSKDEIDTVHERLRIRLYVLGGAANSVAAMDNVHAVLAEHGLDAELEVIDVYADAKRAAADGIVITPTLIKLGPGPERRLFGKLEKRAALLSALDIAEASRD
jgi:circadian clock protein KaiB